MSVYVVLRHTPATAECPEDCWLPLVMTPHLAVAQSVFDVDKMSVTSGNLSIWELRLLAGAHCITAYSSNPQQNRGYLRHLQGKAPAKVILLLARCYVDPELTQQLDRMLDAEGVRKE